MNGIVPLWPMLVEYDDYLNQDRLRYFVYLERLVLHLQKLNDNHPSSHCCETAHYVLQQDPKIEQLQYCNTIVEMIYLCKTLGKISVQ